MGALSVTRRAMSVAAAAMLLLLLPAWHSAPTDESPSSAPAGAAQPTERALSAEDTRPLDELRNQIHTLRMRGDYTQAVQVAERLAALCAQVHGPEHWLTEFAQQVVGDLKYIATLPEPTQAELAEAERTAETAIALMRRGRQREALAPARQALEVRQRCLPAPDEETVQLLMYIGFMVWEGEQDLATAEDCFRQAMAARRTWQPADHPYVADDMHDLGAILDERGKYGEAERWFRDALAVRRRFLTPDNKHLATSLSRLGMLLLRRGDYAQAEPLLDEAVVVARALPWLWPNERQGLVARTLYHVALLREARGDFIEATRLSEEALALQRGVLAGRRAFVETLERDAQRLYEQDDEQAADAQAKNAENRRRVLTEDEAEVAQSLNDLARMLHEQGRLSEAEPLYREALQMRRNLGGVNANVPQSLNNLARLLHDMGENTQAEDHYREALTILGSFYGEQHPDTAQNLHDLGQLLHQQGRFTDAEELYRRALRIRQELLGDQHPDTVQTRNDLAQLLHDQGQFDAAEEQWSQAAGGFEGARLRASALGLERTHLMANHSPLIPLATCLARRGQCSAAYNRLEANLARGLLDTLSARSARPLSAQERAEEENLLGQVGKLDDRIALLRQTLGDDGSRALNTRSPWPAQGDADLMGLPVRGGDDGAAGSASQPNTEERRRTRAALTKLEDERLALSTELARFEQAITQRYGVAAGQVFALADIQRQIPADAALVAWVDILGHPQGVDPGGEHWACLVRNQGEPVWVPLRGTGEGGRWEHADDDLPKRVRDALSTAASSDHNVRGLIEALSQQRLVPITAHLEGATGMQPVRRLIVLPTGWMAGVPLEALTDRYVITHAPSGTMYAWLRQRPAAGVDRPERDGVGTLLALGDPVFSAPHELAKPEPAAPDHGVVLATVDAGSCAQEAGLQSGDVLLTYDGHSLVDAKTLAQACQRTAENKTRGNARVPIELWRKGQTITVNVNAGELGVVTHPKPAADIFAAERGLNSLLDSTRAGTFTPLPGTRREVEVIARLFAERRSVEKQTVLLASDASEQKLDELSSSGRLAQFRFLHLATHCVMDDQVAMRSGLILAQDQLDDPLGRVLAGKPVYDGKLTADQIVRDWRLNADLVVLSGCRTALGKVAGGEGYLGFSQALFIAGARNLLLSLWKVDDTATALLMMRFYANLLGQSEQTSMPSGARSAPLPFPEALQEAKLWLRNLTAEDVRALCRATDLPKPRTLVRGEAGAMGRESPAVARPFEQPYYWSAFILIGGSD